MTRDRLSSDVVAEEMFAEVRRDGQSARGIVDDAEAEEVRAALRRLGRAGGDRLRTARLGATVVVARLDAQLWRDDQATMRAKLTPPA